ncbi:MAG: VOC family protein [Ilumatobacteraceae bacterium]
MSSEGSESQRGGIRNVLRHRGYRRDLNGRRQARPRRRLRRPRQARRVLVSGHRLHPLGGVGSYVLLIDESGQQPKLLLQRAEEPKVGKNRMHFDIETPAVDEEVARLEVLGAVRMEAGAIEEHGNRWVVMADPEGNESCVCNAGHPDV